MAQKDPLVEYTGEGERMFTELGRIIRGEVVLHLFHAELAPEEAEQQLQQAQTTNGNLQYEHDLGRRRGDRCRGRGRGRRGGRPVAAGVVPSPCARAAREARPQRPVLVRLRQEVQEVPRRLARR